MYKAYIKRNYDAGCHVSISKRELREIRILDLLWIKPVTGLSGISSVIPAVGLLRSCLFYSEAFVHRWYHLSSDLYVVIPWINESTSYSNGSSSESEPVLAIRALIGKINA